jgi:hypothetical protein
MTAGIRYSVTTYEEFLYDFVLRFLVWRLAVLLKLVSIKLHIRFLKYVA